MTRNSFLLTIIGLFLFSSCKENKKEIEKPTLSTNSDATNLDTFGIDPSQSIIYWLGTSRTGKHNGSLNFLSGTIYSSNKIIKAGELAIDMKSITNLDLTSPKKEELENHLKNSDFFFVDSFPLAYFKMSSIAMMPDSIFNATIDGVLTIKNISKPLQLKCKVDHTDDLILITVPEFTIDRTEYNIMYKSKKLINAIKDKFIHDEITLSIKLSAKKL